MLADWLVVNRALVENDAAVALRAEYDELTARIGQSRKAWAGSWLARLFIVHPWLASATLNISVSSSFDDRGGCFDSYDGSADDICLVDGVPLTDLSGERLDIEDDATTGQLEVEANAYLHEMFCDDFEAAYLLHAAMGTAREDLVLKVKREDFGGLLDGADQVSGAQVYETLKAAGCVS